MACILYFAVSVSEAADVLHHVQRFCNRVMTFGSSLCCQASFVVSYSALLPIIPAYSAAQGTRNPESPSLLSHNNTARPVHKLAPGLNALVLHHQSSAAWTKVLGCIAAVLR